MPPKQEFALKLYLCSSKAERLPSVQVTTGADLSSGEITQPRKFMHLRVELRKEFGKAGSKWNSTLLKSSGEVASDDSPGRSSGLSFTQWNRVRREPQRVWRDSGSCDASAKPNQNTTVLFPYTNTRFSTCHRTARDKTTFSRSRPLRMRSSTVSRCDTRTTSCSMIGPSSSTSVT